MLARKEEELFKQRSEKTALLDHDGVMKLLRSLEVGRGAKL